MLSLGSRDEGMKGLGIGFRSREGAMEENELEEGEAFSGRHDDDACIDPDIALSYIDEKLQDVLGHFQKDFEGGVSAENLGAKFGGYGSFLPAYQRSPSILSQPRSPPRPPNPTVSKSPYNSSTERVRQNPSVHPRVLPFSKNSTAALTQPSESSRKENCMSSLSAGGCVPYIDSSNKQVNASEQKSLKVRIKVGPDNTLARSNAAIYSGLGLDSPSSTPEDSPDASPWHSPGFRGPFGESPLSILQVMTCFSVPGGYLLSPLHDNLFRSSENETLFNRKASILGSGALEMCHVPNMALSARDMKGYLDMTNKSDEKKSKLTEEDNLNCKWDSSNMLKKEMDVDAPSSRRGITSTLNTPLQSWSRNFDLKAERCITGDEAKDSSQALGIPKELNKPNGKDTNNLLDSTKDDQCISIGSMKNSGGNLGEGIINSKGKLNSIPTLLENGIEGKNPCDHKEISSDTLREGQSKKPKGHDINKLNGDEYKGRDEHTATATAAEHVKQMPAHKVSSHEKDAEKMLQGIDQAHIGKRKTGSHHNHVPLVVESVHSQGDLRDSSFLVQREKKKFSRARGEHSQKKSKSLKSSKDTSMGHSREPQRDAVRNINAQRGENRADVSGLIISTEKSMDRSGVKKDVNMQLEPVENTTANTSFMCAASADAAVLLDAPLTVIKENWVCCDRCQKWRLLPYGTDPNILPTKWKCSMQVWLPGLNKCSISEEKSKEAFNALYLVPAPVIDATLNGHHVASGINSTDTGPDHGIPSVPTTGRKMSGMIGASNVPKNFVSKKNIQASVKSRSMTDVDEYPLETKSSVKTGLGLTGKSIDFSTEKHHKQNGNHEIPGRFSDGGDFVPKSVKHSKSKNSREVNQDGHRKSKKYKKEDRDYIVEERSSDIDLIGRAAPDMDSGLPAKVTGKVLLNCSDHSSSKDSKAEQSVILSSCNKKSKDLIHSYSNGDFKDHYRGSDADKSCSLDYVAKKRKVKEEPHESRAHSETVVNPQKDRFNAKEAFSEGELRKQKKAKVSKHEGNESSMSNVDGKNDKKCRATRILLSGNREKCSGVRGGGVGGNEQMGYQDTQSALDGNDPLSRDMTHVRLSTAATSSSSKVSGSRKSKANLHEARGSPVDSVSSSPLRTSTIEKISIRRNSAAKVARVNLDSSFMGSPKRCSDGELGSDQSGTLRKDNGFSGQLKSLDSNRAAESAVIGSIGGACHVEKKASHLPGGNNKDGLYSTRGALVDLSPADFIGRHAVDDDKNLFDGSEKDNNNDVPGHTNYRHHSNGTSQRKSDKSSSGLKERNRSSDCDVNRNKLKIPDSICDKNELYSTKNGSIYQSEADVMCNNNSDLILEEKDEDFLGKKKSSAKRSHFDKRDDHCNNGSEENLDAPNKDLNARVSFGGTSCKSNKHGHIQQSPYNPSENPVSHSLLDRFDRSEMDSGKGMSQPIQPIKDKTEALYSGQAVPIHIKGSMSDAYLIDSTNGDAFKVAKRSRKPDNQNDDLFNNPRQVTPNDQDSSPMRKDGPSVANVVLKEARDLKHTANRLKNEGLEQESIGLYFQAALKFLYGASLLEPSGAESAKHGEMNPSMQMISMYSDTARLCEYCAHEYERHKEMASAALAYKCVEVAYMKVAYYKHPGANRDRHELLNALQTVLPGESPSSSASDVDNLNNQGAVDRAASAKSACSPQIVGNHVIAARNRPNFMRLLSYTNDLNCAFDATKRSQNAVASVSLEKDGVDGMSSVRKVLDFNFHNVEGLLRLVRLSMESISR